MDRIAAGSEKPAKPKTTQDKKTSKYAAGASDNPIMLAQVKVPFKPSLYWRLKTPKQQPNDVAGAKGNEFSLLIRKKLA